MNELDVMWVVGLLTGIILNPILKELFSDVKEIIKMKTEQR